jgi:hypothetical protein
MAKLSYDDLVGRFEKLGYPKVAAQGIADNVIRESDGNSTEWGDNRTSYGLFQHHNERRDALLKWAGDKGRDASDPDTQIDFAEHELKTQYPELRKQLLASESRPAAESAFRRIFERPASIMWSKDTEGRPVLGNDYLRFSDAAFTDARARRGTRVAYMDPQDYLDLSPELKDPWSSRSGRSLQTSLNRGDEIDSLPSLDLTMDGPTARVTDQDGRHRALAAQAAGLDQIPVAMRGIGEASPTEFAGMQGRAVPNQTVPADRIEQRKTGNSFWGNFNPIGSAQAAELDPYAQFDAPTRKTDSAAVRFGAGAMDPVAATAQIGANVMPQKPTTAAGLAEINAERQRVGLPPMEAEANPPNIAQRINQQISDRERAIAAGAPPGMNWMRLAGNVAGALPLAAVTPFGGSGVLATGANVAAQGALAGAMQPVAGARSPGDVLAGKAAQAGVGAAGGVLGAGALSVAARGLSYLDPLIRYVGRIGGPKATESAAVQEVLRTVERDVKAGGPTAQNMIDLSLAARSAPLALADVGGANVLAMAGRMARSPGQSREIMTQTLNSRDAQAGERLVGEIDRDISGGGSSYDAVRAFSAARSRAAKPLYEAAYDRAPINPDLVQEGGEVANMMRRPSMKKGMQNAARIIQEEGGDMGALDLAFNEAGDVVFTRVPSWRTLDYVKRGLDDVVESYRDSTTGRLVLDGYGYAAQGTRAAFRDIIKRENPEYAQALNAWAGPSQLIDATKRGEGFLRMRPEEITRQMTGFTDGEREAFKLGAADALRKAVMSKGVGGDEAKAIIRSAYTRAQLRPLFRNEEDYGRFIASVEAEGRMFGTRFDALRGSHTAARTAEDLSPENEAFAHAARGAVHAAHGNWLGAIGNALRAAVTLGRAPDERLNAEIARLLVEPLNRPGARGMSLLQNFGAAMPQTRNYMLEGSRKALPYIAPAIGATLPQP